jgi:hypothetical protein
MAVLIAMETISPPPTFCVPLAADLRQLFQKYTALFLCKVSYTVPTTTRIIMTIMYVCITEGDMDAESSANGLVVNIKLPRC